MILSIFLAVCGCLFSISILVVILKKSILSILLANIYLQRLEKYLLLFSYCANSLCCFLIFLDMSISFTSLNFPAIFELSYLHSFTECNMKNTVQYEIYCTALSQSNCLNQTHHLINIYYLMFEFCIMLLFTRPEKYITHSLAALARS